MKFHKFLLLNAVAVFSFANVSHAYPHKQLTKKEAWVSLSEGSLESFCQAWTLVLTAVACKHALGCYGSNSGDIGQAALGVGSGFLLAFCLDDRIEELIHKLKADGHVKKATFLRNFRNSGLLAVAFSAYRAN